MPVSTVLRPIIKFSYKAFLKPILFTKDPELVHDAALIIGRWFGAKQYRKTFVSQCFAAKHPMLEQTFFDLNFASPIGLAAGFDKNANLVNVLGELGFGFGEIGSVTGRACKGNTKPRLWRLPQSKSLAVYYGLANEGAQVIAQKVQAAQSLVPLGMNIAKTNDALTDDIEAGIADYVTAWKAVESVADYITINISCPNTSGGQPFIDPILLERLLSRLGQENSGKPVFIKLSPDLDDTQLDNLLLVIGRHRINGLICSNLTHHKTALTEEERKIETKGGLSGKAVESVANDLLRRVYLKTKGKYILVGCGGIFSAEDAYTKIKLGASLLQIITGMIYEGPQLIGDINRGLVKLLQKDGYKHISEAVGADIKK